MQVRIIMEITGDDGGLIASEVVADLAKVTRGAEDLGLSLAEGKALLARLQWWKRRSTSGSGKIATGMAAVCVARAAIP